MDAVERTTPSRLASPVYDGFISYSHAADDLLAPRLQAGLQRFAKPWWKRRALRIFRDESSLAANPHLWSSITQALDTSGWFVLLLSPDAAQSEWVGKEIEHWVANKDPQKILPVVTDGEFGWENGDIAGSAAPPALSGVFTEEPRWVDLRFAHDEEQLDLKNPEFSNAVADVASSLRGIAKDELASEEVRQHRRTVRTAWAGGAAVAVLAVAATGFGIQSARNADLAAARADQVEDSNETLGELNVELADTNQTLTETNDQLAAQTQEAITARQDADAAALAARSRELWASAALALESDPSLAALLALEASDVETDAAIGGTEIELVWRALLEDQTLLELSHGYGGHTHVDISADGSLLAVASADGASVQVYDTESAELRWERTEDTADSVNFVWIHPEAAHVAVGIVDSEAETSERRDHDHDPDDLPNRIQILSGADGTVERTLEFAQCLGVDTFGWSSDGQYFLLASGGGQPCLRDGAPEGAWVEVLDAESFESVQLLATGFGPVPAMDASNRLFVFAPEEDVFVAEPPLFSERRVIDGTLGLGAVNSDGTLIVTESAGGGAFGVRIFEVDTGQRIDLLDLPEFASRPLGLSFSPDGSLIVAATEGSDVVAWSVTEGLEVARLPGGSAHNAVMSSDGSVLYSSHPDGVVRAWDMVGSTTGAESLADLGTHRWVNGNSFVIGRDLGVFRNYDLAAPDFDPLARVFDLTTGEIITTLPGVVEGAMDDGRFLLFDTGRLFLYDPSNGAETILFGCAADPNTFLCLDSGEPAPEFGTWASIEGSEIMLIRPEIEQFQTIDRDSGMVLGNESLDPEWQPMLFSRTWVMSWTGGDVIITDRQDGDVLFERGMVPAQREMSNAGDMIAIWGGLDTVTFIDVATWETREILVDGTNRVRGMAFGPNDDVLALGHADFLAFHDVSSGDLLLQIPIEGVSDIHWLDEESVVVGTWNGEWLRLPLGSDELLTTLQTELRRTFTDAECSLYRIDPCPTLDEIRGP